MMLSPASKLKYTFKTPPYSHQKRALAKIQKLDGRAALFMEMGTGKTKVAIDWAGIGYYNYGVRRVLVVAPLSVLGVWPKQVRLHSSAPAKVFRLRGNTKNKLSLLKQLVALSSTHSSVLSFAIINYESIWREDNEGVSLESWLVRWAPDLIIFDESHRLKHPTSKQSRAAYRLTTKLPNAHRLILTGTPITKAPLDAFGQMRCLNDRILGDNWHRFKNTYGVWGGFGRYQLRGYRNLPELIDRIHTWSFRIKKEQCLDLPEKVYQDLPVTLSSKALKLYRDMAEEMIAEIEDTHATAAIVLVKLLRLSQITSGFVKDVEGNIKVFDDSKLNTCMDLLSDILEEENKVVIFTRFITDIQRLADRLTTAGIQYRILSGSVPAEKRDSFVEDFHKKPEVRVFIAQIQAGSLGIDLTPASSAIFFSMDYNAANYWQAQDRLHRIGQTHKVTYYHLVVPRTVDQIVLNVLKEKGHIAEAILHNPKILLP